MENYAVNSSMFTTEDGKSFFITNGYALMHGHTMVKFNVTLAEVSNWIGREATHDELSYGFPVY